MPIVFSSQTILQTSNKVLENIGERQVTATSSTPVGRKAAVAVRDSVVDIAQAADWDWAKDFITLTSWTTDQGTMNGVENVYGVSYGDTTNGFYPVAWVDNQTYDRFPIRPFTSDLDRPQMYTIYSRTFIKVNRYPTTTTQQNKLRVYVGLALTPGATDSSLIPVPDPIMPLVIYRACFYMSLSHLDDPQAASMWAAQYEDMLKRVRAREHNTPMQDRNLFRKRV